MTFFFLNVKRKKHDKILKKKKEKKNLTSSYNITPESNFKVK